jgi:hypothetical protein
MKKIMIMLKVVKACKESTITITVLRLNLSAITPVMGDRAIKGIMLKKYAIDKYIALSE